MRSPGVIYRKYRQVKKRYLYDKVVESRKKMHANCYYGRVIDYIDHQGKERSIRLCTLNFNPNELKNDPSIGLDVCTCPIDCNAFASKYNVESIKKEFERELKDPAIKRMKYPELVELEWVLDKSLNDAKKEPSYIGTLIINIISFLENILKVVEHKRINLGQNQEE